jgi:hypothetical protein
MTKLKLLKRTAIGISVCFMGIFLVLTFTSMFGSYDLAGKAINNPDDQKIDKRMETYKNQQKIARIFLYVSLLSGGAIVVLQILEDKNTR